MRVRSDSRLTCMAIAIGRLNGGNTSRRVSVLRFAVAAILLNLSPTAIAAIQLPWSTTFDCPEWVQLSGPVSCDGIDRWLDRTTVNGSKTQITADANFPAGGGGRGMRNWAGDGINNHSGGLRVNFVTPVPEFWIRWYMRYQPGFKWAYLNYHKMIYVNVAAPGALVPEWHRELAEDTISVWTNAGGNYYSSPDFGWPRIMGGSLSDGKFHAYEVHVKKDTNGSNGVLEMWVDGKLALSRTNANTGTVDFTHIGFGSNHREPQNGVDYYIDYDDFAISTTGYIGPIGAPEATPPSPPELNVQ